MCNSIIKVEIAGFDSNGGPCYIGTGCFHRRETLCGKKYSKECEKEQLTRNNYRNREENACVLEETCKALASCSYEDNTQWGNKVPTPLSLTHTHTLSHPTSDMREFLTLYKYELLST